MTMNRHNDLEDTEPPAWQIGFVVGGWLVEVPQRQETLNWVLREENWEEKKRKGSDT